MLQWELKDDDDDDEQQEHGNAAEFQHVKMDCRLFNDAM
jgi:hypothetical protein